MTSKLKCPFCKEEIISDLCLMCDKIDKGYINGRQIYKCNKCSLFGNKELWQALIRRTNQLNIAITDIHHAYKSLMGGCAEWRLYLERTLKQIQDLDNEQ